MSCARWDEGSAGQAGRTVPASRHPTWSLLRSLSDRPQLPHVRYDHFVAEFLELLATPDRVHPCLHRDPCLREIGEPLLDRLRRGPETTSTNDVSISVERAVMAE